MSFEPKYKAKFSVTLSGAPGRVATVDYATLPGTALPGTDYTPTQGRLTFGATETTKLVEVDVRNAAIGNPGSFRMRLSRPVNCELLSESAEIVLPGGALNARVTGASFGSVLSSDQKASGSAVTAKTAGVRIFGKTDRRLKSNETVDLLIRRPGYTNGTASLVYRIPLSADQEGEFFVDDSAYFIDGPSMQISTAGTLSYQIEYSVNAAPVSRSAAVTYTIQPNVAGEPTLAWYASGRPDFWSPMPATGTNNSPSPITQYVGRVLNNPTGVVSWRQNWRPAVGQTRLPTYDSPKGPNPATLASGSNAAEAAWAWGVAFDSFSLYGNGVGELRYYASVDGVEIPGYLWITYTSTGPNSYSAVAWGFSTEA